MAWRMKFTCPESQMRPSVRGGNMVVGGAVGVCGSGCWDAVMVGSCAAAGAAVDMARHSGSRRRQGQNGVQSVRIIVVRRQAADVPKGLANKVTREQPAASEGSMNADPASRRDRVRQGSIHRPVT